MGRVRRRRPTAAHASTDPGARRPCQWLRRALVLVSTATIIGAAYVVVGPALEHRQLVALAAPRSTLIFGAHGSAADFETARPLLEAAFREARVQGAKVLFIHELGTVGWPNHPEWKGPPPADIWLNEIERAHPSESRAWFAQMMEEARDQAKRIASGQLLDAELYEQEGGAFLGALDRFLVAHRDQLAGVAKEDLQWEDYVTDVRYQAEVTAAINAFITGRPDDAEARVLAAVVLRRQTTADRDRNLVRQMGRLLREHPGSVVVTHRGELHWSMLEQYGLRGSRPSGAPAKDISFGLQRLDIASLSGAPLSPDQSRRLLLLDPLCRLVESHLVITGRVASTRDTVSTLAKLSDDPRLTMDIVRELSAVCGRQVPVVDRHDPRATVRSRVVAERLVYCWLVGRGFLAP